MTHLHLTEPWWYYALLVLAAGAVILEFWFIRWSMTIKSRRYLRRLDVVTERLLRFPEDVYWNLRRLEAARAHTIAMARAVREHPERIEALLAENPVRLHVVDEVSA